MKPSFLLQSRVALGWLLLCLLATGCGKNQEKLVPVEGVLKINNRPAANVSIQFLPDGLKGNKGPTSYATTDKDGKFRLKTMDGREGAVEGPHNIVLADMEEERTSQGSKTPGKTPRLDSKYAVVGSGLNAEVKEGTPVTLEVPVR